MIKKILLMYLCVNISLIFGQFGWSESSSIETIELIDVGPGYYYSTREPIYIRLGQENIVFHTNGIMIFLEARIRYDGGNWITVCPCCHCYYSTDEIIPPWNEVGDYQMKFQVRQEDGNWSNVIHNFPVHVVPAAYRRFIDNTGNSMILWKGGSQDLNYPYVIIEGFDPRNVNDHENYYYIGKELITEIRDSDGDILIFNFANGGISIADNAQYVKNAINYINLKMVGQNHIVVAGLSMGGLVCRYALAEAEDQDSPLNVSQFISIDSPQQNAIIDSEFQDYINQHDSGIPHPTLNSTAAKQMLQYNTYNPSGTIHAEFYSQLNDLNGDGYPHLCKNIGISFSPNTENPNSGIWLEVEIPGNNPTFSISPGDPWKEAGSFLPLGTTQSWGYIWWLGWSTWELIRHSNPTFIPHQSALDLINGVSKFDVTIASTTNNFHDVLPSDVIKPLLIELGINIPMDLVLTNRTVKTGKTFVYKAQNSISAGNSFVILSGANVTFCAGNYITLNPGFTANSGCLFYAYADPSVGGGPLGKVASAPKIKVIDIDFDEKDSTQASSIGIPLEYSLSSNFPNPFNPTTTFKYALKEEKKVTIKIYDILGKEITTLVNETQPTGYKSVIWNGTDHFGNPVPSGIYICKMIAGDFTKSQKMVLMK